MKKIIVLPLIFLMNLAQAEGMLTLGVVPQQSASSLAKTWVPLTLFLSNKIGKKILF